MNRHAQHGFTLWELLMTLLVAGILFGIGVPNILEFARNGNMTAAANDLLTGLLQARAEAVKRQAPVVWCLSDDPLAATPVCSPGVGINTATRGYIVWVDENDNFDADGGRILTDATDNNLIVDPNERILSRITARGVPILVSTNCGHVTFLPNGFPRTTGAPCNPNERVVLLCDDRGRGVAGGSLATARVLLVNRLGRAQVLTETATVNPWATAMVAGGATCPVRP
jgi:type IV fimbrial biogenesis protein FimT